MFILSYSHILVLIGLVQIVQAAPSDVPAYTASPTGMLQGELRVWHKLTLGFTGPMIEERATPNPFTDYRLDVEFTTQDGKTRMLVPGYFAADGNAANSHAKAGNVWVAHFVPPSAGVWNWKANFYQGKNIATTTTPQEVPSLNPKRVYFDGQTGSVKVLVGMEKQSRGSYPDIAPSRDFRRKGKLRHAPGYRYYQFAGSKEFFMKAGPDSPENLLSYSDIDNTPNNNGWGKTWSPHLQDFREGIDPTWSGGKGKAILGGESSLVLEIIFCSM